MKNRVTMIIQRAVWLLVFMGVFCFATVTVNATTLSSESASGVCGDLTWSYANGTVTVDGVGAMPSYNSSGDYPWFDYVEEITTVVVGDKVTAIGTVAFVGMPNLTEVKLGRSVSEIGNSAFASCPKLEKVNIPASLRTLGIGAFSNCTSLRDVQFEEGITAISSNSFFNTGIVELKLPDSVTEIAECAFMRCPELTSIKWPMNLKIIKENAFSGCPKLTEVALPASLEEIKSHAFYSDTMLKSVSMGDSVKSIGLQAFGECPITSYTSYSVDTSFGMNFLNGDSSLNVYGWTGSTINKYATNKGFTFTALNSLGKPVLKVIEMDSSSLHVYWDKVLGALTYDVYRSTEKESGYSLLQKDVSTSNCVDTNVQSGYTYYYKIVAKHDSVESAISDSVEGVTYIAIPVIDKAVMEADGIHVYWNAISGVSSYNVYRADTKDDEFVMIRSAVTATDYVDTTVESGKTYYYKISAVCNSVESLQSNMSDGITYIAVPTVSTTSLESTGLHVYWNAVSGATSYKVWRSTDKTSGYTLVKSDIRGTDYLDTSVIVGNTYYYKITSVCGATESLHSAPGKGVAYVKVPTISETTNTNKGISIIWSGIDGATAYNVYRSTALASGYSLIKSGVTGSNYTDTSAISGKTYYYKVTAVYGKLESSQSQASNGITYLAAPTFKKVVNVVSGVHVYWNASAGAKTYDVYRSTTKAGGYSVIKSGLTATHYIDTTAKSGTTYYYKIVAVNGSAKSAFSAPFNAITYVGTPDITSRFNKGAGVQLGWNKIEGATGYAIYRKPYEGTTWTRVTTIAGNNTFTWMDESVKANNGTVYKYTIRALAGSDMKTLSGCRSTGRTMARLTSRTLNSATKASATSIKCNWSTTSVCNGYEVRFMVGDTVYKTFTVGNYKTGVKTFTGLKAGQTYKIQVRSYKKVDGVGTFYSAWSTAKTVSL